MVKPLPVHGADISHHQADVDLERAQDAGLDWLAHKATQGSKFIDGKHETRQQKSRAIRLPFMSYHFGEDDDPKKQLDHFLHVAGIKPGDMRPMLDLEDDKTNNSFFSKMSVKARTSWVKTFVDGIKREIGVAPFIYTPFDLGFTFDCPLWVARYHPSNEKPHVPQPWPTYTIRQFTNGQVGVPNSFPGLGHVDLNCWNGDPDKLLDIFTIPRVPGKPPVIVKPPVVTPPVVKPPVVTEPTAPPKPPAVTNEPDRPMKAPSTKRFGAFFHMLARFYQDYADAVLKASRRKKGRAMDVDAQRSKEGTGWALHWATVGQNKLHDPKGQIGPKVRIDSLTDEQIERLRGPQGQKTHRLSTILRMCNDHNVRAEVEVKVLFSAEYARRLMSRPYVQALEKKGLLQVKTLATMGAPTGPVSRLAVWHRAGAPTILSFSTWTAKSKHPISKKAAWPVVDYTRGTPRWAA